MISLLNGVDKEGREPIFDEPQSLAQVAKDGLSRTMRKSHGAWMSPTFASFWHQLLGEEIGAVRSLVFRLGSAN